MSQTVARRPDCPPVHLRNSLNEVQTDSKTAFRTIERSASLIEECKDVADAFSSNSDAGIAHRHRELALVTLHADPNAAAALSILRGIHQQVHKHLGETHGIAVEIDRFGRQGREELMAEGVQDRPR